MKTRTAIFLVAVPLLAGLAGLLLWTWRPAPPGGPPAPVVATPAADGSIYTDKLFQGLLALEASPIAPTRDQAAGILEVLDKLDRKLVRNQMYDDRLMEILTPAQIAVVEAGAVGLDEERMRQGLNPGILWAAVQDLERLSGQARPKEEIPAPPGTVVQARDLQASRMSLFVLAWPTLQADPTLAVGAEQAGRLLPWVYSYVSLKTMKQQTKADILQILRPDQIAWIDAHGQVDHAIHDMTVLTRELRAAMVRRATIGG